MVHRVNLGGGGQAFYNYDAGKQRTRKRIEHQGNTVEERLYLGGMELYRRWLGNNLVEEIETHHLFVDEQRVLMVEDVLKTNNSNLPKSILFRYQYSNHLGSVGLELDGNAAVISYEEYHPYGTTAYRMRDGAVRATAKRYRYTGMERDEETGLSYHTARYYLPWLGRWGSVDPIGIKGGINQFIYASCKPVSNYDKSGKQPEASGPQRQDATGFPLTEEEVRRRLRDAGVTDPREIQVVLDRWRIEMQQSGRTASTILAQEVRRGAERREALTRFGFVAGVALGGGPAAVAAVIENPLTAGALAFQFLVGLADPHPPGASPLDMPGPVDDAGRATRVIVEDVAPRADDIARSADDVARLSDDVARTTDDAAEATDDATRAADDASSPISRVRALPPRRFRVPSAELLSTLGRPNALTHLANRIHGMGQRSGATVEIAQAITSDGRTIFVAGTNSSAGWSAEQLAELERLGIEAAPINASSMTRGEGGAPHAEENIAAFLDSIGARGVRWSRAVVGEGGAYVCRSCQSIIRRIGGYIE
jgi:RHS repeat-associated protein